MSVRYRIFRHEKERGLLGVEYGEVGSGVTAQVSIAQLPAVTEAAIHEACVKACPIAHLDILARLERVSAAELATIEDLIGKERELSEADERAARARFAGRIPMFKG